MTTADHIDAVKINTPAGPVIATAYYDDDGQHSNPRECAASKWHVWNSRAGFDSELDGCPAAELAQTCRYLSPSAALDAWRDIAADRIGFYVDGGTEWKENANPLDLPGSLADFLANYLDSDGPDSWMPSERQAIALGCEAAAESDGPVVCPLDYAASVHGPGTCRVRIGGAGHGFENQWSISESFADGFAIISAEERAANGWTAENAEHHAQAGAETYAEWANGDVYGFMIEGPEGIDGDSCWGFVGHESASYMMGEARESAQALAAELLDEWHTGHVESARAADRATLASIPGVNPDAVPPLLGPAC